MSHAPRILIVEDDVALACGLQDLLRGEGCDVRWVAEGNLALAEGDSFGPDLVILDLMLPGRSGFELCEAFGERGRTPVLVLTALGQRLDKVRCLRSGADDYLTKPFDADELVARVRAVLRRSRRIVEALQLGTVTVDFATRLARKSGVPIELSEREFEILHFLGERVGQVVSRDQLLREVWGFGRDPLGRPVDTAIARLRAKIEPDPRQPRYILTVHGDGYSLCTSGNESAP